MTTLQTFPHIDAFSTSTPAKTYVVPTYKTLRSALMNTSALQTISRR